MTIAQQVAKVSASTEVATRAGEFALNAQGQQRHCAHTQEQDH
jgi:hypothetical protein